MTKADLRSPGEVARELGISTSTLRRWAKEFNLYLSQTAGSPSAAGAGSAAHRRYTPADLDLLSRVKTLLDGGMTYLQVIRHLKGEPPPSREDKQRGEAYPIIAPESDIEGPALGRSFVVVADALRNIGDNQQAIQNSLQVNRNLLGVLIQDNFNLKEENAKLRDRVLKLEQFTNQFRQERQQPTSPVSQEQQAELETRKGCLGFTTT